MLDLYYWPTPNGHKVTIFLEEVGLDYRLIPVNIGIGDQFKPDFLKIAPNNRMPALVDSAPIDGEAAIPIFESGAILLYLAEKTGNFMPSSLRGRMEVLQWLMWQMGGLGPMLGQNHHFRLYAQETLSYAIERYTKETARLYAVLDKQLIDRDYITGSYSIADMACYPWIVPYERQGQNIADFPNLHRWFDAIAARPAVIEAYAKGKQINQQQTVTEESKKILFGQDAGTVRK